ncbi:unnamed protein product (macronuclear) [Paramecium tetraurelia]|uniref:PHD-type domain-containing protein n=1 Tax=Paramecium tetraurelia TaxID=5888 RepID=A0BBG6_PARTE|nr:uncharacterized protein GSPATT00000318001 [Paramecium tetraurelia]CAK55883.1 unnamed protein product [Paramecium tetraurelia]|eukprot:XP_001423281.1 hypothetical protein (macronuclear) [Paramecium tetraurelia strain d4-2]
MVLCSICGRKKEEKLYTILLDRYRKTYLELKRVEEKRQFLKKNYKEYCHLGCIVFFLQNVQIIQEKYYLAKDKCVTDYIFFGLDSIHKSKQLIDCSICDQGLNNVQAPQKKASINCSHHKCKMLYHIDCIIQVKKRITCTKARINFYCNQHFDKNELQADWNQWESIAYNLVQENIHIKQEEAFRGEIKYLIVSVDDPFQTIGEKLDQNSFKRLDEDLTKKLKVQKKETKVEQEKKRQKFWDISKDFKSQYEFGPRPMFQIDYQAKKKEEMLVAVDEEEQQQQPIKKAIMEEIIITDDGIEINKIEKPKKKAKPVQKVQESNVKVNNTYSKIKTEQIEIDKEEQKTYQQTQENGDVSLDQLLSFVREKKSSIPTIPNYFEQRNQYREVVEKQKNNKEQQEKDEMRELNEMQQLLKKKMELSDKRAGILNENNQQVSSLNSQFKNNTNEIHNNGNNHKSATTNFNSNSTNYKSNDNGVINQNSNINCCIISNNNNPINNNDQEGQKKVLLQKEPLKQKQIPNADMIENDKQNSKLTKVDDYSSMSASELLNFLLKNQQQQNRTKNRRKNETTRALQAQHEIIYYPQSDEAWEENLEGWWNKVEETYFNPKQDIYSTIEKFKKTKDSDKQFQENLKVLFEIRNGNIMYAEYSLQDDELYEPKLQEDQEYNFKFQMFKINFILRKEMKIFMTENLTVIEPQRQSENSVFDQFSNDKDSQVYVDYYFEKYYENELEKLKFQNQIDINYLNQQSIKEKAKISISKQGHVQLDKLRYYQLLKNTKLGMKQITDEEHQMSIKKKIDLLSSLRTDNFFGKCNPSQLKQGQKDELARETCCKVCFNYQLIQLDSNNDLSYCGTCLATFHKHCYNTTDQFENCDQCKSQNNSQVCYICQKCYTGIPLREIEQYWVHITCALLCGLLEFNQTQFKLKKGIIQQSQSPCMICEEKIGVQLSCKECDKQMHLFCAFLWGFEITIQTEPDCLDPYISTYFLCPKHFEYSEKDILKQTYYRQHGINFNQAGCFETLENFIKCKLIAHQKVINRIQNMLQI